MSRAPAVVAACLLVALFASQSRADTVDQNVKELSTSSKSYKVRLAAALALSKSKDARAVLALADALDKDEDATVRRVAALALQKTIDQSTPNDALSLAIAALEKASSTDGDSRVRETASNALRAVSIYKKAAAHPAPVAKGDKVFVNVDAAIDQSNKAPTDGLPRVTSIVKKGVERTGYATAWAAGGLPTNSELASANTRAFIVASTVKKVDISRAGRQTQVACTVSIRVAPWAGKDGGEKWEANKAASASGSAKAMTGNTDREVAGGVRDCLEAVSEDVTSRQVVPFLKHLATM
ncbi:MAG: HEAT repeat domain-containing protein [Kofleriaceae bacterium]